MNEDAAATAASTNRRNALSVCVAAVLGLALPTVHAATFVTNCNDAGNGSLRAAVLGIEDGGTVDMLQLTTESPGCSHSTITLTTGDIHVARNNVKILGPGRAFLVTGLDGKYSQEPYRIFTHNGIGTFEIDDLSMSGGDAIGDDFSTAWGGCIWSKGKVTLKHVSMEFCSSQATSGYGRGGAIFSYGKVSLYDSLIQFNHADGASNQNSLGGAVSQLGGGLYVYASTLSGNSVGSAGHSHGFGGAIYGGEDSCRLVNTTISGNSAYTAKGGIALFCTQVTVVNSTISGNSAASEGGAYFRSPAIGIYNSTFAFNTSELPSAGLRLQTTVGGQTVKMYSTLVSNNTYGPTNLPNDVQGDTAVGSYNLIFAPSSSVPEDTIVGKCPLLAPLADNGGPTKTHALHIGSPAIDKGINPLALLSDQRGSPFVRESSLTTPKVSDIGAFELDRTDAMFSSGFDGCP